MRKPANGQLTYCVRRCRFGRPAVVAFVVALTFVAGFSIAAAGSSAPAPVCADDRMPTPPAGWSRPRGRYQVPEVRVLYFVPSDLSLNPTQRSRIAQASQDVHRWYADHTARGKTMRWAGAVETVNGYQPRAFYAVDFWGRVLTELGNRGYPIWGAFKVFEIPLSE